MKALDISLRLRFILDISVKGGYKMYSIKQVSEMIKITSNAIRFYEKKGLIKPNRNNNGYRVYSIEDISHIQMITLYRKMGFSLESIEKLLSEDKSANKTLLDQFAKQYNMLNQHIHSLVAIRRAVGGCVEKLLENSLIDDEMIQLMDETAKMISDTNEWKDLWNFDNWAENYDNDIRMNYPGLNFYKNYDMVIEATAKEAVLTGNRIIEIGVGTGNLAKKIISKVDKSSNLEYIGVDQSLNMLKVAKSKCTSISLRLGTFLQLPFDEDYCDTVVTSYAFHHCNTEEKVLAIREMDRILKKSGRIIITDLMFENMDSRNKFEEKCSAKEIVDLKDEYFGNVDEIEEILHSLCYSCVHKRIDELIWIVVATK